MKITNSPRRGTHRRAVPACALGAVAIAVAATVGALTAGVDEPIPPLRVDGKGAFEEVRAFVALGPRIAGTAGAEAAAAYLSRRIGELGLTPHVDAFEDQTRIGMQRFRNVTATIPGSVSNTVVVLLSHYDTKAGIDESFVGANDSGSSTGLLLALAPLLKARRYPFAVMLAFVDGEEAVKQYTARDGLHGSRRLVAQLAGPGDVVRVRAVILLDMIGDRDLTVTVPANSTTTLVHKAFAAAAAVGVRHRFRLYPTAILDDHVPFLEAGIPAIDLIDFEYGSRPGRNNYWHTPADTLDKLSPESLASVGAVVLHMLQQLAEE